MLFLEGFLGVLVFIFYLKLHKLGRSHLVIFHGKLSLLWHAFDSDMPYDESCRKKVSSLEKERQDLQLTIDALQEGNHT